MASSLSTRTKVLIIYSQSDKEWLERLKRYLKPLVREGRLDCWDDTHIRPGDDWQREIRTALDTAQVAVLLISADFFASDFIDETELPPLLDAARAKGVRILPVILSASQFAWNSSLAQFQTVNPPDWPLAKMPPAEQEKVLDRLAQTIEAAFNPSVASPRPLGTPPGMPSKEQRPQIRDARFTVYHPKEITPERWDTLLVYAHISKMQEWVYKDAQARLRQSESYGQRSDRAKQDIDKGAEIIVVPELPGCQFNPPTDRFHWFEDVHRREFRLRPTTEVVGCELAHFTQLILTMGTGTCCW